MVTGPPDRRQIIGRRSRSTGPYPVGVVAPSPWSWQAAWVELAAVAVLAVAYVLASRGRRPGPVRAACFAGGLLLLVALAVTPLATLALHYLLTAHLVQNVALAEWIPLLLVAGIPPALAAELARFRAVRLLTHPGVALPLWLAGYALWHVPAPYVAALEHHALLHLEHLTYLVTGVLLWWCVLHSRPWALSWGARSASPGGTEATSRSGIHSASATFCTRCAHST